MGMILEVVEGPGLGTKYDISAGNTLGGGGCDHVLRDPLISLPTLRIEFDNKNRLQAVNISGKKMLFVNNKKANKVLLLHGVKFKVGSTLFKVLTANDQVQSTQTKPWTSILYDNLHSHIFSTSRNDHFGAFDPPIQVSFLNGELSGSSFIVGFGPREFGYNCFDFDLNDPNLPDRAFAIIPGQVPVIKALSEENLYINEELVTESAISNGDEVRVGTLKFKVNFLEKF